MIERLWLVLICSVLSASWAFAHAPLMMKGGV